MIYTPNLWPNSLHGGGNRLHIKSTGLTCTSFQTTQTHVLAPCTTITTPTTSRRVVLMPFGDVQDMLACDALAITSRDNAVIFPYRVQECPPSNGDLLLSPTKGVLSCINTHRNTLNVHRFTAAHIHLMHRFTADSVCTVLLITDRVPFSNA